MEPKEMKQMKTIYHEMMEKLKSSHEIFLTYCTSVAHIF